MTETEFRQNWCIIDGWECCHLKRNGVTLGCGRDDIGGVCPHHDPVRMWKTEAVCIEKFTEEKG